MKITILGQGVFGSSMASYLTHIGHSVRLDEVKDSEAIFVCTSSNIVLSSLLKFKNEISNQKIIICSKGFTEDGKLLSEVLRENFKNELFFLSGPTLADELNKEIFSGMVLAGGGGKEEIKKEIESENLYIETSDDIIGVEVSSALKNVFTIFIGIVQGMECGQNTNAFVFSKAIGEMKNVGVVLGGRSETFLGLAGVGDLFLISRNRLLGIEIGKGRKIDDVLKEMKSTPGGLFDIKNVKAMAQRLDIQIPFVELLYKMIFENYPINKVKEVIKKC
ncbi:MAG: NAD(P)H-dependent glycerol-3-phosphate dehydrogenase [Candidatus Paceibacterota bacterium]